MKIKKLLILALFFALCFMARDAHASWSTSSYSSFGSQSTFGTGGSTSTWIPTTVPPIRGGGNYGRFHVYKNNVFGNTLSTFMLDRSKENFYDCDNGMFQAYLDVISTSGKKIGTVEVSGLVTMGNNSGPKKYLTGSLDMKLIVTDKNNTFGQYLNQYFSPTADGSYQFTHYYEGTSSYYDMNDGSIFLWGSDKYSSGYYKTILGTDFKLTLPKPETEEPEEPEDPENPVPEPMSMILFGSGAFGIYLRRRFGK